MSLKHGLRACQFYVPDEKIDLRAFMRERIINHIICDFGGRELGVEEGIYESAIELKLELNELNKQTLTGGLQNFTHDVREFIEQTTDAPVWFVKLKEHEKDALKSIMDNSTNREELEETLREESGEDKKEIQKLIQWWVKVKARSKPRPAPLKARMSHDMILIVDDVTQRILNGCFSGSDLTSYGIIDVVHIREVRMGILVQPIYFISPDPDSIEMVMRDVTQSRGGSPLYLEPYRLYFSRNLDAEGNSPADGAYSEDFLPMTDWFNLLNMGTSWHQFSVVKVVPCEVIATSSKSFLCGTKYSYGNLFFPPREHKYLSNMEVCKTAERLFCLCVTMKIYPYIRVTATSTYAGAVGILLRDLIKRYCSPEQIFEMTPYTFLLFERDLDLVMPLLHGTNYATFLHEFLPSTEDGQYIFKEKDGKINKKMFSEEDPTFQKLQDKIIYNAFKQCLKNKDELLEAAQLKKENKKKPKPGFEMLSVRETSIKNALQSDEDELTNFKVKHYTFMQANIQPFFLYCTDYFGMVEYEQDMITNSRRTKSDSPMNAGAIKREVQEVWASQISDSPKNIFSRLDEARFYAIAHICSHELANVPNWVGVRKFGKSMPNNYNLYRQLFKNPILEMQKEKVKARKREEKRQKFDWKCPADRYLGVLYHLLESMLGDDVIKSEVVAPYINDKLTVDEKIDAQHRIVAFGVGGICLKEIQSTKILMEKQNALRKRHKKEKSGHTAPPELVILSGGTNLWHSDLFMREWLSDGPEYTTGDVE